MISEGHKKHSPVARPEHGRFGRNEWAIAGGHCSDIKDLAGRLIAALPAYRFAYVDAGHASPGEQAGLPGRLQQGAVLEYTEQGAYRQIDLPAEPNGFRLRALFQEADAVLVNGNHFEAAAQVVIIDPSKKESLRKRVAQLNNLQLVLRKEPHQEVFDFIRAIVPAGVPVYDLHDTALIAAFLQAQLMARRAVLKGLVLAGGQSLRMGRDKASMNWHRQEQRYYLSQLLQDLCGEAFISCRPEQQSAIDRSFTALPDSFAGLGPYGALLSAFRAEPDTAWLALACDLPLMDRENLEYLVGQRDPSAIATAFASPRDGSPEPLATIWEPKSYPVLLSFLAQGINCPAKVLRNSTVHLLKPLAAEALTNVNTAEEEEAMRRQMKGS